jgi:FkbM family methyltransferase
MGIGMNIKKMLNKWGYDVKNYRPVYETTIKPLGIKTIIDIGANVGLYSAEMRQKFPEAMIYAFEPLEDCFEKVEDRMKGDAHFKAWHTALGDTAGSTEIQRSSFHPSSSLLTMAPLHKRLYPKSQDSVTEKIEIKRLDDILRNEKLEKNILVKIDVQGF